MRLRSLSIPLAGIIFLLLLQTFVQAQTAQSYMESGNKLMLQGNYYKASLEFESIKQHFSSSDLVPAADYQLGLCWLYLDHPIEAAMQFQRIAEQYPTVEAGIRALEMNTILYRLYLTPATDRRPFIIDPSYSLTIAEMDEPTGMAIDSKLNIYISDKGKKIIYVYDSKGIRTNALIATTPYAISIDSNDQALIANDLHVVVPGKDPVSFRAGVTDSSKPVFLEEIRSVATDRAGDFFVVSRKQPGILVYGPNREPTAVPSFPKTFEFYKVLVNSRDQVLALDKDRKQILAFDRDGRSLFTIQKSETENFDKIEDFAIDAANHIYLLTSNPKGILIYSPAGKLLKYIPSTKKSPIAFEDGKLITVSTSGSIYVLDKDSKRVLKIG